MTTQRMTPEQRASELLCAAERMARVGRPFGNSREDMFDALTAAITSAEDEALERAAQQEEARGYLVAGMVAKWIRSLKSPVGAK